MRWQFLGWLGAKLTGSVCTAPWMDAGKGDNFGRFLRRALPWRLSNEMARALAGGAGSKIEISWILMALALIGASGHMLYGDEAALRWVVLALATGLATPVWFGRASGSPRVVVVRGRLWLALVSTGELCASMGRRPSGPDRGWAMMVGLVDGVGAPMYLGKSLRARRMMRHVGFMEMAKRLARPLDPLWGPESSQSLKARVRLRAMMLACAGSEHAARWLWRRRKSQLSMERWARSLGEGASDQSERWEVAQAARGIESFGMAVGGFPVPFGANEATESSLPLLWATATIPSAWNQGESFAIEVRREVLMIMRGRSKPKWGWREEVDSSERFKKMLVMSLRQGVPQWESLASQAASLLEAEELGQCVMNPVDDLPYVEKTRSKRL